MEESESSLQQSAEDANIFLGNELQNHLQITLSSLELPMVVSIASGQSPSISAVGSLSQEKQGRSDGSIQDVSSNISQFNGKHRHKAQDPGRDISIQVLEKFSLVTKFARDTTSQIFREMPPSNGFDGKNYSQCDLDYPEKASIDEDKVSDEHPVPADPLELATFLDSEGREMDSEALKKRIFFGGVKQELRKEIWSFLLGCYA